MRIKDVIRAEKAGITSGTWQTGPMPKSLFPLGKSGKHFLNFRGAYDWYSFRFSALGNEFRVLIAVNFGKCDYYAHLGIVHPSDTQMLMSFEYHASHAGWHIHSGCGDIALIPVGRYKGQWKRRIPKDFTRSRQTAWDLSSKEAALEKACTAFNIPKPSPSSMDKQIPLSL
jgi:hypothetical protein